MHEGKLIDDLLAAVERAENGSQRRSLDADAQNCRAGRSATAEDKEANSESEQLP
jgi:hypothetical protein